MLKVNADYFVSRSSTVAARMLGDEMMIVSAQHSTLYTLNDTGAAIWSAADGKTSLSTIAERLCAEFDVEPAQALEDARSLVNELEALGIMTVSEAPVGADR